VAHHRHQDLLAVLELRVPHALGGVLGFLLHVVIMDVLVQGVWKESARQQITRTSGAHPTVQGKARPVASARIACQNLQ
jgi:hypothetical protein